MDARRSFNRHSIRLKEYDYSQPGFYFVTICVKNKKCILGDVFENDDRFLGKEIKLSALGEIVEKCWLEIPEQFKNVELDEWTIMPNHLHGIIVIKTVGAALAAAPIVAIDVDVVVNRATARVARTLGDVVGSFKSISTNQWLQFIKHNNIDTVGKFWQRNYYEHIIGNEKALSKIRNYIINNPNHWGDDIENPQKISSTLDSDKYYSQVFNAN
jgi:putative transposase